MASLFCSCIVLKVTMAIQIRANAHETHISKFVMVTSAVVTTLTSVRMISTIITKSTIYPKYAMFLLNTGCF